MRIGIFAGTFDPIHDGHVTFAQAAIKKCALDRVVFLPERSPRAKQNVSDLAHRTTMIRLAIEDLPGFDVLELPGANFSVAETLPQLRARYKGDELYLLLGSDVASTMAQWSGADELLRSMQLVVGVRAGHADELFPAGAILLPSPRAQVAASVIRASQSGKHVAAKVLSYIKQNALYEV